MTQMLMNVLNANVLSSTKSRDQLTNKQTDKQTGQNIILSPLTGDYNFANFDM